jgi:hypothetical protein
MATSTALHEQSENGGTAELGRLERQWLKEMTPLKPELERETAQAVFRGNTGMTGWVVLLLLVPLNILIVVIALLVMKARVVIVTDRHVHIFEAKARRKSPSERVVTLNRPAEVKLTRFGLQLGEEKEIYAVLRTGAMKRAAALAQQPPA